MVRMLLQLTLLITGFLAGIIVMQAQATDWAILPDGTYASPDNTITGLATTPQPQAGPADRITEEQIAVRADRVTLDLQNAQWSRFTDTKSMEPVIHAGANAIQVTPKNPDEIQVGDIISYKPNEESDVTIIHRVIEKGVDEGGEYFIARGDNLASQDPGKIRFDQIKRVVVAIIY